MQNTPLLRPLLRVLPAVGMSILLAGCYNSDLKPTEPFDPDGRHDTRFEYDRLYRQEGSYIDTLRPPFNPYLRDPAVQTAIDGQQMQETGEN
ncbi:MAG: hypothetical protein IJ169_06175 [Paludibacteraceae bacterium]|nr:hypothetical protein [Paludibacteraceae bacterium]